MMVYSNSFDYTANPRWLDRMAMMEAVRKTADFSENQTKFLLKDLNSDSHSLRAKGVKRYQEYIQQNRPDMYEDVVDLLFLGNQELSGLLRWCGSASSKHGGQLKRISADVISLIKFLLTLEPDEFGENVFFDRFIRLPAVNLREMNLSKHLATVEASFFSSSRSGNAIDACEILSIVIQYHVNDDGEPDPLDINFLLHENVQSLEAFRAWLRQSAAEEVSLAEVVERKRGGKGV
jgi:hypothetical protein